MTSKIKNIIQTKTLLIFDCDGVLFNSGKANLAYFEKCLKETLNIPLAGHLREKATYMSVRQLFQELIENPEEVEEMYRISQEIPYDPYLPLIKPAFDFERFLLPLREEKYLAIATNRAKSLVKLFKYFNLFKYFHYKTSTCNAAPKPAPDMLFNCCDYFDVEPADTLFIGDAISDKKAAAGAHITYIHIGTTPDTLCIDSVPELLK